jgi:hypothetical protein
MHSGSTSAVLIDYTRHAHLYSCGEKSNDWVVALSSSARRHRPEMSPTVDTALPMMVRGGSVAPSVVIIFIMPGNEGV